MARADRATQDPLTLEERRGKQIYLQGTSPSGEDIVATLGEAALAMPGNLMACANCHGVYGRGKAEGNVRPSNLSWQSLSTATSTNRIHPGYNERSLEVAITQGKDPAGNKLLNAMPRFQISKADLDDLIAYLKRLDKDRDPGVSDSKLVIGAILPKGSMATMGQTIKAVLAAYFDELNAAGGIYNRRVDLRFVEAGDSPAATRAAVERFIKGEQIFALVGSFIAGTEKEIIPLMDQWEVPLVGPITLYPQTAEPLNRYVFYLLSGLDEQARVLVDFAAGQAGPKKIVFGVVYPRTDLNLPIVGAIKAQCEKNSLDAPQTYEFVNGRFDAAGALNQVKRAGVTDVILLGNDVDTLSFMREAEKLSWFPSIYGVASSGGSMLSDAPLGFDGKTFIAFPTSPADQTPDGMAEFRAFAQKHQLGSEHIAMQVSTYSAAKLMLEGLRLAGKDVSREQLVLTLEGLHGYKSGLTPVISFGPDRRVGALGAYVVGVDLKKKKYSSASAWLEPK